MWISRQFRKILILINIVSIRDNFFCAGSNYQELFSKIQSSGVLGRFGWMPWTLAGTRCSSHHRNICCNFWSLFVFQNKLKYMCIRTFSWKDIKSLVWLVPHSYKYFINSATMVICNRLLAQHMCFRNSTIPRR